jgi:signal transduction histidine kinase
LSTASLSVLMRQSAKLMKQTYDRQTGATRVYQLLLTIEPFISKRFIILLSISIALIVYMFYTRDVVKRLQDDAVNVTQTYAELIRAAISESMSNDQMNIIFDEILQKTNIPIVITDTGWTPLLWKNIRRGHLFLRKDVLQQDASLATRQYIEKMALEFMKAYEPKPIYIKETSAKFGYLVFGNSDLIIRLSRIPIYAFCLVALFFFVLYLSFRGIRVTERSNLWVGLAKETAHQLGTPISSLMGWVGYIKGLQEADAPIEPEEYVKQVRTVCEHMEKDLSRLRKITSRFSQIGSVPTLSPCDINSILADAMGYFQTRLPFLGKHISIESHFGDLPKVAVNKELLEWVLENLLKNSLDAIVRNDGLIEIRTEYIAVDKIVRIYHGDNGKGISWEAQKKIFTPGYSTKKRGWGLGLTLAKRIVEEYHKGRIYVNWSQKDKGTVFCIDLPVETLQRS